MHVTISSTVGEHPFPKHADDLIVAEKGQRAERSRVFTANMAPFVSKAQKRSSMAVAGSYARASVRHKP